MVGKNCYEKDKNTNNQIITINIAD